MIRVSITDERLHRMPAATSATSHAWSSSISPKINLQVQILTALRYILYRLKRFLSTKCQEVD